MRRELLDPLADVRVIRVEGGVAEEVNGDGDAEGLLAARRSRTPAMVGRRVVGLFGSRTARRQPPVRGESHVVELDLVEPLGGGLLRDGDCVIPCLVPEGVQPGELLVVARGPRVLVSRMASRGGGGPGHCL